MEELGAGLGTGKEKILVTNDTKSGLLSTRYLDCMLKAGETFPSKKKEPIRRYPTPSSELVLSKGAAQVWTILKAADGYVGPDQVWSMISWPSWGI